MCVAGGSSSRRDVSDFCSDDIGGLRTLPDALRFEDYGTKGPALEATVAIGDSVLGTSTVGEAIIPSFSSNSSYGCFDLPAPSSMKAAVTSDTTDSGRAEGRVPSEEGKWPDFELFANESELRLGDQVSDLHVCPEIEDILEVHASSELATSARAHISKVLVRDSV